MQALSPANQAARFSQSGLQNGWENHPVGGVEAHHLRKLTDADGGIHMHTDTPYTQTQIPP